ncbi:hypothetical protein [Sporolactobacillus inulinus]|uniref:Uncharacterized protein n=1 Tax=Sporolactobacillus inulinus CASD TaxID=1069536 RepID=A0A0U1QPP5_9BACL|nr:hypothetical protein [Sporolactobacillus inulinus]KLI02787.1 hypothetical protein SINU_06210 [Sporolactobacillus inulinus CASD]GEB78311.1 hypothetical protein SIN01_26560 [Sporolactobacillus inulinus]
MHASSSLEQQNIEKYIFQIICDKLGVNLAANPIVQCGKATIRPDFYSEEPSIIGEVYAHIGSLKPPQKKKMLADILKMLLLEKVTNRTYRKIIVICDDEVLKAITGKSWGSACFKAFDVEIMNIDIGEDKRELLLAAQKRQFR